jgi:zinc resistance-associated protein
MWKPIAASAAAVLIAGSSLVYAQNRPGREGPQARRPNVEDLRAYGEARLAALKAGLALTAEQEKNWPAFEQAAREFAKLRIDRANASVNTPQSGDVNPADRIGRRATAMIETGNALKKLGDATGPLYNSLDENQKRRFAVLSRLERFGGDRFRDREGRDGRDEFRGRDGRDGRDGRPGPRGFMRRSEGSDGPMMQHPPMGSMRRSTDMAPPVRGEERL